MVNISLCLAYIIVKERAGHAIPGYQIAKTKTHANEDNQGAAQTSKIRISKADCFCAVYDRCKNTDPLYNMIIKQSSSKNP